MWLFYLAKKQKGCEYMPRINDANSHEKSVLAQLKDMVKTDTKVYWILWKFAPDLLPTPCKTFADLQSNYVAFKNLSEDICNRYIYLESVQAAVKWLLKRMDGARMIELYNIYFERAKSDVQAFKALIDFKKEFFQDEESSELLQILNGANISTDTEEEEDFSMDF